MQQSITIHLAQAAREASECAETGKAKIFTVGQKTFFADEVGDIYEKGKDGLFRPVARAAPLTKDYTPA